MNLEDAYTTVGPLVANTVGWDEARTLLWVNQLLECSNRDAAVTAMHTLIDSWRQTAPPPWGVFRDLYDRECRQHSLLHKALPAADREILTHGEYIARLRTRAERGDEGAKRELASWERIRRTPFASAIPGVATPAQQPTLGES